jgi:N6-adenosine-specific RNA methylase IME4
MGPGNGRAYERRAYRAWISKAGENMNPKIELFARERRPGWDCWGYEVPTP